MNNESVEKAKVLIADDHPRMRAGIISLLTSPEAEPYFEVVGEAQTGLQTLMLCRQIKPDILILDLQLEAEMTGFEVIEQLRAQKMPVKILVLTATNYTRDSAAVNLGVEAYVLKSESDISLLEALLSLTHSKDNSRSLKLSANPHPKVKLSVDAKKYKLPTNHELHILQLAASGLTQAQIAQKLEMEKGSVGVALGRIYIKLNVKNVQEAVSFAYRNKLFN